MIKLSFGRLPISADTYIIHHYLNTILGPKKFIRKKYSFRDSSSIFCKNVSKNLYCHLTNLRLKLSSTFNMRSYIKLLNIDLPDIFYINSTFPL